MIHSNSLNHKPKADVAVAFPAAAEEALARLDTHVSFLGTRVSFLDTLTCFLDTHICLLDTRLRFLDTLTLT